MPLKSWLILFSTFLLSSCGSGPTVKVCVSDPMAGGFDCFDQNTQQSSFLLYANSDKYVAFDPADAQTVLTFCAQGSTGLADFTAEQIIGFVRSQAKLQIGVK